MTKFGKLHRVGLLTGALMMLTAPLAGAMDIHTEILIEAAPETVWTTLSDLENYPSWNPYHVQVGGVLEPGAKLNLVIHKPNGKVINLRPRVKRVETNKVLVWGGGVPLLFTGNHVFELEEVRAGCTRLVQREKFSGALIPFLDLSGVAEGYANLNASLKFHIESNRTQLSGGHCKAQSPRARRLVQRSQ